MRRNIARVKGMNKNPWELLGRFLIFVRKVKEGFTIYLL